MSTTRRQFLATAGSFAITTVGCPADAAMGPNDKFDLVIKGGDVLDPSQSLRGKRDIGIRFGVIEALEAEISAPRAQRVLDATGKLVTPGSSTFTRMYIPMARLSEFRPTSWSRISAPRPACRRVTLVPTTLLRFAATSRRRRALGSMPSCT
jgi:hypothetical protein